MFERNRIDRPIEAERHVHHVALTLADGSEVTGRLMIPASRGLFEELNTAATFVEVETYAGERIMLAKGMIREVRSVSVPKSDQLARKLRQGEVFEPHEVLRVAVGSDKEAVRASYHRLAKLYHPDRYSSLELPKEVFDYISAMSVRLNAAYAALQETPKPPHPASPPRRPAPSAHP